MFAGLFDEFIQKNQLLEAMKILRAQPGIKKNPHLKEDLEACQNTYLYMLDYAAKGMVGPDMERMRNVTCQQIIELFAKNDFWEEVYDKSYFFDKLSALQLPDSPRLETYRIELENLLAEIQAAKLLNPHIGNQQERVMPLLEQHQLLLDSLFDFAWCSIRWNKTDTKQARDLLKSSIIPTADKSVLLSGICLSLCYVYDSHKFIFLMQFVLAQHEHTDKHLLSQAVWGICVASIRFYEFWKDNTLILDLMHELRDMPNFGDMAQLIMNQYLVQWRTKDIQKIMMDDIIPSIIKGQSKLSSNDGVQFLDMDALMEQNPEWMNEMHNVQDKIQQIAQLQAEGYDTQVGTFSQLKNGIFFHHPAHWVLSFTELVPDVAKFNYDYPNEQYKKLHAVIFSHLFCDSDKFSMLGMLNDFPDEQRDKLIQQFTSNQIIPKEGELEQANLRLSTFVTHFLQNLYRFTTYSRYHAYLPNPFDNDFREQLVFSGALSNLLPQTTIANLGEAALKQENPSIATELFEYAQQALDAKQLQKYGYCLEKKGLFQKAVDIYEKVDLMEEAQSWTLKHMIQCYTKNGNHKKALETISRLKKVSPQDTSTDLIEGECYMSMGQYEQALTCFHRAIYYGKTGNRIIRAIAWCLFLNNQYQEAILQYEKVKEPNTSDYMNIGHTHCMLGNLQEAIQAYARVYKSINSYEDFVEYYQKEMYLLAMEKEQLPSIMKVIPDILYKMFRMKKK